MYGPASIDPSKQDCGDAPSAAPQGTSAAVPRPARWLELITEQDIAEAYQSAPNWHSVLSSLQCRAIKKYRDAESKVG